MPSQTKPQQILRPQAFSLADEKVFLHRLLLRHEHSDIIYLSTYNPISKKWQKTNESDFVVYTIPCFFPE